MGLWTIRSEENDALRFGSFYSTGQHILSEGRALPSCGYFDCLSRGRFLRGCLPHRGHFVWFSATSAAVTDPPRCFSLPCHTSTSPAAVQAMGRAHPQLRPRVSPSSAGWRARLHPRRNSGVLVGRILVIAPRVGLSRELDTPVPQNLADASIVTRRRARFFHRPCLFERPELRKKDPAKPEPP